MDMQLYVYRTSRPSKHEWIKFLIVLCIGVTASVECAQPENTSSGVSGTRTENVVSIALEKVHEQITYNGVLRGDLRINEQLVSTYRRAETVNGTKYLEINLDNKSKYQTNFTLTLVAAAVKLEMGNQYLVEADLLAHGIKNATQLALGYQIYDAKGNYLQEYVGPLGNYKPWEKEEQRLGTSLIATQRKEGASNINAQVIPRLSIYNIPVGARIQLRFSRATLGVMRITENIQPVGTDGDTIGIAPGAVMPYTFRLSGLSPDEVSERRLLLRSTHGSSIELESRKTIEVGEWGVTYEVWRPRLPRELSNGLYDIVYELSTGQRKLRLGKLEVSGNGGQLIGYGFHRYPGISQQNLGKVQVKYNFARSMASDSAYLMQWWLGAEKYDWTELDTWADYHSPAGKRKLLITFSGTPTWASAQPNAMGAMGVRGNTGPPKNEYRDAYRRMVFDTVSRYKTRIVAVECWNEPNSNDFFTGSQTDLADLCKDVYLETKSVNSEIAVICPQADDPTNLDFIYSAKTSRGEPIHQFCDMVGAHMYNRLGKDAKGNDYSEKRLQDGMQILKEMNKKYNIVGKKIAITEYGVSSCDGKGTRQYANFGNMTSETAAEALYQSIAMLRSFNVELVALYSYDHGDNDPICRPGGSFIRTTKVNSAGQQSIDSVIVQRLNDAFNDFGRTSSD